VPGTSKYFYYVTSKVGVAADALRYFPYVALIMFFDNKLAYEIHVYCDNIVE
jgi:hypothetical protein